MVGGRTTALVLEGIVWRSATSSSAHAVAPSPDPRGLRSAGRSGGSSSVPARAGGPRSSAGHRRGHACRVYALEGVGVLLDGGVTTAKLPLPDLRDDLAGPCRRGPAHRPDARRQVASSSGRGGPRRGRRRWRQLRVGSGPDTGPLRRTKQPRPRAGPLASPRAAKLGLSRRSGLLPCPCPSGALRSATPPSATSPSPVLNAVELSRTPGLTSPRPSSRPTSSRWSTKLRNSRLIREVGSPSCSGGQQAASDRTMDSRRAALEPSLPLASGPPPQRERSAPDRALPVSMVDVDRGSTAYSAWWPRYVDAGWVPLRLPRGRKEPPPTASRVPAPRHRTRLSKPTSTSDG